MAFFHNPKYFSKKNIVDSAINIVDIAEYIDINGRIYDLALKLCSPKIVTWFHKSNEKSFSLLSTKIHKN
jgi:hypothetical protein